MHRCLQLAAQGLGTAAPNPIVGAVLVHDDVVIGEGFHQRPGGPHAEVVCLNSVQKERQHLIEDATLYVSLEPCSHHGRTPPCTDLVLKHKIKRVVIGCADPFEKVRGTGIAKLHQGGVEVTQNILDKECVFANRRFFATHIHHRPYIILKWAQTADGFIGTGSAKRLRISNALTNRLVHKWRSEEAAIMVGTNTALFDDPSLTTRHWPNRNPLRIVVDRHLRLPGILKMFNDGLPVWVLTAKQHTSKGNVHYHSVTDTDPHTFAQLLQHQGLQSVLVEGGRALLQSFIDAGLWDECRIITAGDAFAGKGTTAPTGIATNFAQVEQFDNNCIATIYNPTFAF